MITFAQFRKIPPDTIVRVVVTEYERVCYGGNGKLKFVVTKGCGQHDWAIYYGPAKWSDDMVRRRGDKLTFDHVIQDMYPCDQATMEMYRK